MRGAALLLLFPLLLGCSGHGGSDKSDAPAARQAEVADRGRSVMPFEADRTMHHFRKSPSGGVQQIVSSGSDARQVELIREHLRMEAGRFQRGDFSDPATIHGAHMPGLSSLSAGAKRLRISYSDVAGGGQITYETHDPALVKAIHDWFDAQVSEHGRHAMRG